MKEIEVKVYRIDVAQVKRRLQDAGAKPVKNVLQRNVYYMSEHLRKTGNKLRIRYETDTATKQAKAILTTKSGKRFVHGHKIEDENELVVDGKTAAAMLQAMGFQVFDEIEVKRDYYSLRGCSVEICTLPDVPAYLEIEGPKECITQAAKLLGFTGADFRTESPRKYFGVKRKQWVFKKS